MKLVDMYGKPQKFPFMLGERGRGRVAEEVRVDRRRPPADGATDVGYHTFTVDGRSHTVITAPTGQPGILVRVCTEGVYTQGSTGRLSVMAGDATTLAEGQWAYGIAGKVGFGPDALLHVADAAILSVVLSGGEHKGLGQRYVFVDGRRGYVRTCTVATAIQDIVTDEDPVLSDLARRFAGSLPSSLAGALATAERLENAGADESTAVAVQHYIDGGTAAQVSEYGLRLPPNYCGGGLEIGPGSTLIPGDRSLVILRVGPGGGKRYSYDLHELKGLDVVHREKNHARSGEVIVALMAAPDWCVSWTSYRDGISIGDHLVNATGRDGESWPTRRVER